MLSIWTVVGFLALSDLGMTRSASRFVAEDATATEDVVRVLWRVAIPLGVVIGLALVAVGAALSLPTPVYPLAFLSLATLMQFASIGALEAQGRFLHLAVQRLANAAATYVLPVFAAVLLPHPTGMWVGVAIIVAYRVCSLFILARIAGLHPLRMLRTVYSKHGASAIEVHSFLTWIAISSIVGPAFLYADRVILATVGVPADFWVFYTATSELLMKTYVLPSAILSVVFPWLINAVWRSRRKVSLLFVTAVPLLTVIGVATATLAALFMPGSYFNVVGIDPSAVLDARLVLCMLFVGTVVNWSSQFHIALLQVVGRQRLVAISQIVLIAPFIVAMAWAIRTNPALDVPFVSTLRVVVLCIAFWLFGYAALRVLPVRKPKSATQTSPGRERRTSRRE